MTPGAAPSSSAGGRRRLLLLLGLLAGWAPARVGAQPEWVPRRRAASETAFVRFAALPVGGAVEWRRHWDTLLAALGARVQRPVSSVSVAGEEALARAIARDQVDVAFLGGRLALDAVSERRLRVVAQMACEPAEAPQALLLTRRAPGLPSELDALLSQAARWRLARGEERSLSGFVVPQAQLLLPRGLPMETAFRDERVGSPQETLLALANGDVDLATADSLHFASFAQQFPLEAARLRVVWRSAPIPAPLLLVREEATKAWKAQVRDFFVRVGEPAAPPEWRAALNALQMPRGFRAADNRALLPVAQLVLELGRQRAAAAQWVSEAAREARLHKLAQAHARQVTLLQSLEP
ncbi:phosphate/phosphite/phosphonate ABC transporter substrate-binding protein [Xenophilus sp. Marseille-Q4582]|uniref:phosphate/phosphite/phosphonate ABC transporter substrate-binding protein n=1 Tax=Xenophilus sp. Marseille-Q4582 TaxID=2866600 RepID=UPI001CE414EE|nr:PhnD/SsuA/transferrin family substrate-binding protein [Xenophilus sp. Marseille-Q4582]